MDKLWAPWRSKYIYLRKQKKCVFCGNRKSVNNSTRYVVERTRHSFSMLNLYPYNNGHVMVAPFRHVNRLGALTEDESSDLLRLVTRTTDILDKTLKPQGYNIGMNIGKIGGAGFAGHIHIHIVPRWTGDTNFMPILADSKVVPDSLGSVYNAMKKEIGKYA